MNKSSLILWENRFRAVKSLIFPIFFLGLLIFGVGFVGVVVPGSMRLGTTGSALAIVFGIALTLPFFAMLVVDHLAWKEKSKVDSEEIQRTKKLREKNLMSFLATLILVVVVFFYFAIDIFSILPKVIGEENVKPVLWYGTIFTVLGVVAVIKFLRRAKRK